MGTGRSPGPVRAGERPRPGVGRKAASKDSRHHGVEKGIAEFHVQHLGNGGQLVDGWVGDTVFDPPQVGDADSALQGQFLLGKVLSLAQIDDGVSNFVKYRHGNPPFRQDHRGNFPETPDDIEAVHRINRRKIAG